VTLSEITRVFLVTRNRNILSRKGDVYEDGVY
jgi:hypothetical protein